MKADPAAPRVAVDELEVASDVRANLEKWLALLGEWNQRIDLTAARSAAELSDLMLADAVLLAAHVPPGARVVDVGAGAGAPGLALAIMRSDLDVTLVEPLAKRTSFLRTVVGSIGRVDVKILRERGEALASRAPRSFDVAISRATLAPVEWIPLGLKLAPTVWALLAKEPPPEVPGARIEADIAYRWPATGAERRAVRYV